MLMRTKTCFHLSDQSATESLCANCLRTKKTIASTKQTADYKLQCCDEQLDVRGEDLRCATVASTIERTLFFILTPRVKMQYAQ
jgi:hypothetical protein